MIAHGGTSVTVKLSNTSASFHLFEINYESESVNHSVTSDSL